MGETVQILHCLKWFLEENDFLCSIDVNDAHFSMPLCMSSKKFVRFAWSGNLYKFLCLFWIRTYSLAIFKTIEVKNSSVAAVESINFDNVLLMGRTFEEILMSRNTLIFSALTSKFCHKSEKISPENGQVNIIFRPTNRYTCRDFDCSGKRWKR